jgi:23S rRNA pseudouridine1911/1915/1917 synthase
MTRGLVVLHEDPDMLVVEKPAGMHTAPLRAGETGTLLARVIEAYPEVAGVPGVKDVEPGLVHRLDRETSGVVVVARTAAAFRALRASFQAGAARKTYRAACAGADRPGPRVVESRFAPWGPGRAKVRVVAAGGDARGTTRDVYRTDVEVGAVINGRALVRAVIARGFRHQVRVHLAHLGLLILGDPLYGAPVPSGREPRMYLHAERIEVPHPATGAAVTVVSPVPPSFAAVLEEEPHELP